MVYFQKEEFPELDDFMEGVAQSLGFEFRKYSMSYREGMEDLVDNQNIKVCIVSDSFVLTSHGATGKERIKRWYLLDSCYLHEAHRLTPSNAKALGIVVAGGGFPIYEQ